MLRSCGLRNRQILDNITGDAAWVGDQEFHNLEPDRVTQSLKHCHEPILVDAGDIERTTRLGNNLISSHSIFIVILR